MAAAEATSAAATDEASKAAVAEVGPTTQVARGSEAMRKPKAPPPVYKGRLAAVNRQSLRRPWLPARRVPTR